MAGIITENMVSRPFQVGVTNRRTIIYDIVGTTSEDDVLALVAGQAPASYEGLILHDIEAEPLGGIVWKGKANYVNLETEYTFDTSGGTQKMTQSLATIASYAPAGMTAPDFQGAIGVSDDRVEGVDVESPGFTFTETYQIADANVTSTYQRTLATLTGCWNNATFRGWNAGEVKLLPVTGSKRGDEMWSITFKFAVQPNQTGLSVGTITGIAKQGWDYLWVRYADVSDTTAYSLVKRPVAAYVERVSPSGDFSLLGIGT